MKIFLISGMREEMKEFLWEYITGKDSIIVMHRSDFYDSCGLYLKVNKTEENNFIAACNAYGIRIRWRQNNEEAA